jgi:two-component system response regulator DegU
MDGSIRILIMDEQDAFRQALRAQLEYADGLTVVGEAGDGQTAIERIGALDPEVILLGLDTPCPDDAQVVACISERYPHVKILVLGAGGGQEGLALDAFRQGAQGYLDKRADPLTEIVAAIRTLNRGGAILDPRMAGWILSEIAYVRWQSAAR